MSEQAHTPGPWKASKSGASVHSVKRPYTTPGGYELDLSVEIAKVGSTGPWPQERAANARLIAAAPDHHAVALELHRPGLVIESAVRNADPAYREDVMALLKANRAAITRASAAGRSEPTPTEAGSRG